MWFWAMAADNVLAAPGAATLLAPQGKFTVASASATPASGR